MKYSEGSLFFVLEDENADGGGNRLYWRKCWISFKNAQQQKNKDGRTGH